VRADLRDPGWGDALPESHVDAVVTATALHWLPQDAVRRLYRISRSWSLGVAWWRTANACRCPTSSASGPHSARSTSNPRLAATAAGPVGTPGGKASREPALQPAVRQRHAVFETTYRPRSSRRRRTGKSRRHPVRERRTSVD
jgi:hypothetical protein